MENESYFDGELLIWLALDLIGGFVAVFTFGLGFPWVYCVTCRWKVEHTVINGKRLTFDGTGAQLFGSWMKWMILTIITFGLYGFCVNRELKKWETKHTHFLGQEAA